MARLIILCCLLANLAAVNSHAVAADEASKTGTIEGTVTYTADAKRPWRYDRYYVDKKNGGALNLALISLSGAALKENAPALTPTTTVVDQKDYTFVPEVVAIRAGDSVKFTNSDAGTHNVFTRETLHPFDVTLGGSDEAVETFARAGGSKRPVSIGCQFHGSMHAWIYVFDHPWYQLTSRDGKFSLKNVPPGTYHIEVTHAPGQLRYSKRIEVVAGQTIKLDIGLSPEQKFEPK